MSFNVALYVSKINDLDKVKRVLADWLLTYQSEARINPFSDSAIRLKQEIGLIESRVYELEHEQEKVVNE